MRPLVRRVPSIAALLLLTLLAASRVAVAASESTCVKGGQQNSDIAAHKSTLQRSPTLLGTRIELANLLEKAGCYDEAVHALEEGQKYNPYNPTLLFSLRRARNLVKEEHHLEDVDQAEAGARLNRKIERCTREHEVTACDEVLSQQPNNTKMLIAKGDALMKERRPAEAWKAYIRASELAPDDTALTGKLQALRSQRQALVKRCTDGDGDAALQACKSVLVKGAANEFEITVRIALLQQSTNQASQALDSYIAANSLRHGDKGVALAILALLQSTQRKDAIALAARGSSLITLGRAHEALAPLRQAKALEPELPDIDQQIKAAEALARTESTEHKERPTQLAVVSAEAEAVGPEPQNFSNVAEATRSN
jgi:tetratricopeptide (TPR) repeat protein